jgi:hypothetical protein
MDKGAGLRRLQNPRKAEHLLPNPLVGAPHKVNLLVAAGTVAAAANPRAMQVERESQLVARPLRDELLIGGHGWVQGSILVVAVMVVRTPPL